MQRPLFTLSLRRVPKSTGPERAPRTLPGSVPGRYLTLWKAFLDWCDDHASES